MLDRSGVCSRLPARPRWAPRLPVRIWGVFSARLAVAVSARPSPRKPKHKKAENANSTGGARFLFFCMDVEQLLFFRVAGDRPEAVFRLCPRREKITIARQTIKKKKTRSSDRPKSPHYFTSPAGTTAPRPLVTPPALLGGRPATATQWSRLSPLRSLAT